MVPLILRSLLSSSEDVNMYALSLLPLFFHFPSCATKLLLESLAINSPPQSLFKYLDPVVINLGEAYAYHGAPYDAWLLRDCRASFLSSASYTMSPPTGLQVP